MKRKQKGTISQDEYDLVVKLIFDHGGFKSYHESNDSELIDTQDDYEEEVLENVERSR